MTKQSNDDSKSLNVYKVPPALYKAFRYVAVDSDQSVNSLMLAAMRLIVQRAAEDGADAVRSLVEGDAVEEVDNDSVQSVEAASVEAEEVEAAVS